MQKIIEGSFVLAEIRWSKFELRGLTLFPWNYDLRYVSLVLADIMSQGIYHNIICPLLSIDITSKTTVLLLTELHCNVRWSSLWNLPSNCPKKMSGMVSSQKNIKRYHRLVGSMLLIILVLISHLWFVNINVNLSCLKCNGYFVVAVSRLWWSYQHVATRAMSTRAIPSFCEFTASVKDARSTTCNW